MKDIKTTVSADTKLPGRVVIKNARLSFPSLHEPKSFQNSNDGEPKYQATLIIPKTADVKRAISEAIKQVARDKWGTQFDRKWAMISSNPQRLSFRDGDMSGRDEYIGSYIISAKSKERPPLYTRKRLPVPAEEITATFYSGCYVNAILNFYAVDVANIIGIFAGIVGIQFSANGEALSSQAKARAEDFDEVEDDDEDVDVDDLEDIEDGLL